MARYWNNRTKGLLGGLLLAAIGAGAASAQVVNWGSMLGTPGSEDRPAPAWIGRDIPQIVSEPAPSDVLPDGLGPHVFLRSARIDMEAGTATLPLKKGKMKTGETVWYIVTDTSDRGISELLGVNYAPKMIFTDLDRGVRKATIQSDGVVVFERGNVDFSPELSVTPGDAPNYFPPQQMQPGSVGDDFYSPLFKTTNGNSNVIYNAPVVAFGADEATLNQYCNGNADHSVVHDKVTAICPQNGTVTLRMTLGYSFAKPVLYLSMDANNPIAASLEEATLTPVYDQQGFNLPDAAIGSGVERIFVVTNGPMGDGNPNRQGLNSALKDGRGPINILGGIPENNLDYSPIWKMYLLKWTDEAIKQGYQTRIIDIFQSLQYNSSGLLVNVDGNPEFQPAGIAV
nr:hypothetical protein [Oculatellaceae cyanobacterium Prado106]